MPNMNVSESQALPLAAVIWTKSIKRDRRFLEHDNPEWSEQQQWTRPGRIIIRDIPFDRGVKALPRELALEIARWAHSLILVTHCPLLPEQDVRICDECAAGSLNPPPMTHQVVIYCTASGLPAWRAFFECHNPWAGIGIIDSAGSRIVRQPNYAA
jgi:hypothetical protein